MYLLYKAIYFIISAEISAVYVSYIFEMLNSTCFLKLVNQNHFVTNITGCTNIESKLHAIC